MELLSCRPGGPHPEEILEGIDAWVRSEPLAALLEGFGAPAPRGPLSEALARLWEDSSRWDYRQGAERSAIVPVDYDPEIDALIDATAAGLGLADNSRPPEDTYDHMVVHGGGPRTALARAHFAAKLADEDVTVGHVTGLGSFRELSDEERQLGQELGGYQGKIEADAVGESLRIAFAAGEMAESRSGETLLGAPWWVRGYPAKDVELTVIAAPTSDPSRRANTADSLTGWAELVHTPTKEDNILLVTTDLFVPFQHYDAVRLLGLRYGCGVQTVGFAPADYPQWMPIYPRTWTLQEVRSAIYSLCQLHEAVIA